MSAEVAPTDVSRGLASDEAARRLSSYGPNVLVASVATSRISELLHLLADPMALMLGTAAGIYLLLGEARDAAILGVAIVPVLGIDVFLQARARDALKKLASAVSPKCSVLRDGRELDISTEALVPGDLLLLKEGGVVHADGVVRTAAHLSLDESQLTGESEPRVKEPFTGSAGPQTGEDQQVFAGSLVLAGRGLCEVIATGAKTKFGHIAGLVGKAEAESTPLQERVAALVKTLLSLAAAAAVALFVVGLIRGLSPARAFLAALSLAVASMPEELPLVLTLFLSLGAWRLGKSGVLVRRLVSVETLGSTTVICTDKTGTLTMGQFKVDVHNPLSPDQSEVSVLEAAALACEIAPTDTLERSILAHCEEHGVSIAGLHARWRLVADYDFDPRGKHMSHVWAAQDAASDATVLQRIVAKGALEGILEHCSVSPGQRTEVEAANAKLAAQGMRVLAVAGRSGSPGSRDTFTGVRDQDERGLSLIGLIGFRDPLRPEVPGAVAACQAAGIRIKIITGDHAFTAHAIADAAGIHHEPDGIITGAQLEASSPAERVAHVKRCSIFARVSPEQKYMIVESLKESGETVAMTGDGINDAPALRRADIGISLGQRGTEVARAAADLVLLDDNFASLVSTVEEGRHIYVNIRRAFHYLIAFKTPIVALALIAPALGLPPLFTVVHLVWLELIIHPVAALIFEAEPAPPDLMTVPPRNPNEPLLNPPDALRSFGSGVALAAVVLGAYWSLLAGGEAHARAVALTTLILGYLFLVQAERALDTPWWLLPFPTGARFWIVGGCVAASLPLVLYVPVLASTLHIAALGPIDWLLASGLVALALGWRIPGRALLGAR